MSDMRETDTSTEAVEAMADWCAKLRTFGGKYADLFTLLRTLLRERNEARRERDDLAKDLFWARKISEGTGSLLLDVQQDCISARRAAFEECAKMLEMDNQTIRLHAGELSAQEMRAVKAVLAWKASEIRAATKARQEG